MLVVFIGFCEPVKLDDLLSEEFYAGGIAWQPDDGGNWRMLAADVLDLMTSTSIASPLLKFNLDNYFLGGTFDNDDVFESQSLMQTQSIETLRNHRVLHVRPGFIEDKYLEDGLWIHRKYPVPPSFVVRNLVGHRNGVLLVLTECGILLELRVDASTFEWRSINTSFLLDRCLNSICLTQDGDIVERSQSDTWYYYSHEKHPVAITLTLVGTVFVVNTKGHLIKYTLYPGRLLEINYGDFRGVKISPFPGTMMKEGNLFVVCIDGRLVELLGMIEWVDHGHPGHSLLVASPPCGFEMSHSVFVVTQIGTLAERHFTGTSWVWIDHDMPYPVHDTGRREPVMIAPIQPKSLHSKVFVELVDGRLAERVLQGTRWSWFTHETSSTLFCDAERTSRPFTCVRVI